MILMDDDNWDIGLSAGRELDCGKFFVSFLLYLILSDTFSISTTYGQSLSQSCFPLESALIWLGRNTSRRPSAWQGC